MLTEGWGPGAHEWATDHCEDAGVKRSPTLEEVALLAGVSRSTVSRVINNSPLVAAGPRAAVLDAVGRVGYVPNRAARSLVTQRTDSFAVVVDESDDTLFENPFFALFVAGAGDALADAGRSLVMIIGRTASDQQRLEAYLRGGHVDGVIFASLHHGETLPVRLHRAGMPVVLAGRPLDEKDLPYADTDNVAGARMATAHLLERGRTRVATVTGTPGMVATEDRLLGYALAHGDAGRVTDPLLIESGRFSRTDGESAMRTLLERTPDLDAVFVASDPMALGVLTALRSAGRRVPDDVAVVSFDGTILATGAETPITTIVQPARELGAALAVMVMARHAGKDTVPVILPTRMLQGRTT